MWSLPDLTRLNSEAKTNKRASLAKARRINDGRAKADELCDDCGTERATSAETWYDIFSDDPKGLILQCESCRDRRGTPEGYFYCDGCNRAMIENYTWERYCNTTEGGEQLCLPCYAACELDNDENWIRLTDEDITAVTFDVVRKAKHLIGVEMPIPKGIKFVGNVELDGSTGGRLTGFDSSERSTDGGVEEVKEILARAKNEGHEKAILILDAAYQFSISIGVYVPAPAKVGKREVT